MTEPRGDSGGYRAGGRGRERSTETKESVRTSEFIVYLLAVAAVLLAGLIADDLGASGTWKYFTFLTVGYIISRGLAKAGSREPY